MVTKLERVYQQLLLRYGPQGWWPLLDLHLNGGKNPTKTGSVEGYHPHDYTFPKTRLQQFEICVGAILTQNTAWPNVEKALINLKRINCLDPKQLLGGKDEHLLEAIRPAGYFNQKMQYLKVFAAFFLTLGRTKIPTREELLALKGIGNETADSMLLYAFNQPVFIVDAYTRRIGVALNLFDEKATYHEIQGVFEKKVPKNILVCQEFHALLVEHAKRYYAKKPYGSEDWLLPLFFRVSEPPETL